MDNFASFYNGRLESNSSKNKNELNKCFERHFLQSKYNNIAHMSPIDRLIAKNQQKMKMNCSSVKKPCSNKKENIDKQNKSKNKDTSVSATIRPRKRRINWNETFKEKRRSRRLSHLPPIDEDFKKEIKNEEFCESYSIKIEKDIKSEIKDDTDDNIQQDNNSNLVLNTSDPNVLSNNCIHQQVEFTQENNSFFGNTINDTLNPSTYSENNFASLSYTCDSKTPPWDTSTKIANIEPSNLNLIAQELIQDDSSICSDELSQEDNSNFDFNTLSNNHTPPQVELIQENIAIFENTMNNLLIDSIYSENNFLLAGCNKTNNCNFRLEPDLTSSKTAYNKQTSMNLVYNHELILETADNEQTNLVVKQELNQETVDYEATNIYNYPYNITNIYDTEIHESESCSPKIIECWSFKTNERLIYSEIEENTSSGTTTVQNNDLNKTQEKSHYKNNFEKPKIIASLNTTNVQDNDLNKTQEKSPYKNNSEKPTIIASSGTTNVQNNDLNKTQEKSSHYKSNSEKPTIITSSSTTNIQNNDLNKIQEKSHYKNNSEKSTIIASSGTTNVHNNDLYKTQEKSHYKNNPEKSTIIASSGTINVQNNDLYKTQEKSHYKNNSEKPTIIESSSLFAMQDELELSIKNRSLTPKTYSRKNQNKMSKPSLLNSSKIATPKANSIYLPSTYFDDTNNKLINYESILPVTQSQNEINYSKLENKITKDSILLNNITVKDETVEEEIPILQKNFYELSIDEKISYQTKLTFVTALELVSIKELKNIQIIKEKKDVIPNQFSSPLELSIDNENYTNKKIVPTGSEIKELSFLLQDSNDRNNTRHAAMPILVPERSSGSSFHPGRICAQNCSACYVILGSMDTVCHIAQVKNPEKQKICLENVNHLIGLNSCLCPTCFHIVQRKSSVAYLSKYVCTFMSCKLPASKYYKSECVKKIKCMLIKTGVKIRSWANNTNLLPTCNTHHDEILKVIQCQLCGNQSTHKKILEISELEDFNKSLIEDGIPITLDTDFFICKSCHLYLLWKNNKLSDSLNKPKDIRDHCSNVIKRICEHHKINIPVSVNEILEKNIIYTDKNVLRIQSKRIPFKPRRKRKVPKKNIKGTHQNTFKMYSKLIPVNSITKNKVPENNIKATDENVFKKSAKLTSTKYNTLNKIPENNITNTAQKTCKIYSKVTPMISNTVNKVYINNFEDVKTIFFKMPVKVMSTKSSTIYKTPTMNSFKTSINNKNDQLMVLFKPSINKNVNCQTLNLQPGRLLPLEFIENQPLSTQPNIKLVHKKKLFTTDTALPRNNLKQILDPLSTNNIPLQKVQHIKSAMKPDTPKLLSCSSNKSMPKQKVGPVVGTSILPLADPLSLPNLPEFQFNDTLKLKVVSDVFKLYKQLQKPFFSSIELFKFLLLLEKYRLQGELIQNKKFKSPCSLKQNSIMNQHIPKYIFPQFKRKRNNKNHCEQLGVTPLHKNAILPINSLYDGKITKYTNMNTNAKVQMKQNLSTPSIPVTTKKEPLIKIISIPKSVVATSICKPSEIIPDNNQIIIPPINTTIDSFNSSPLVISENSTTAAKCITNIENIAMKRVYPLYLNYSPVDLNMTRNFQPIVPLTVNCKQISSSSKKKVKNLKVIHTTQQ
ncbi:Hypothetical protein CINCED_3A013601 [Cinara cedri]|uniref:Uncharacterized protein n=1 Tax=Cinara cedri TaxID=506608 RepID=A0A5E4NS55_9HEMI|nr:Hypothetical protein CINCED_3A013601 [Cinara cedri]